MKSKAHPAKPAGSGAALLTSVDDLLASLQHPHLSGILALRRIILAAHPSIREAVKWNAPSFHTSQHFATVNLRARNGIGVILHFGAKKNAISATGVAIPDPHSLLEWLANDRAIVTFRNLEDLQDKQAAFTQLLRAWIRHL